MSNNDRIYILLPIHNRSHVTLNFIKCLLQQTYKNFQLILIDDGSTDGSSDAVKNLLNDVVILKGTGNWWWAGCLNAGLSWLAQNNISDGDIVLIINDDVSFELDFLEKGRNVISTMDETLLLARQKDIVSGKVYETGVHANLAMMQFTLAESPEEINCLSTRGLFLKWGVIKKIGLFRSILLPHYGSDYEYTIRAANKGIRLMTSPDVHVIFNNDTTGIHELKSMPLFHLFRNLFSKRYIKNPIYRSSFIILLCPWKRMLPNLVKIWWKATNGIFQNTKISHS